MLQFKDFVPELTVDSTVLSFPVRDAEALSEVMDRVNAWLDGQDVTLVNVETVVLPNMHDEDGSEDTALSTGSMVVTSWHQFVRVWFLTA